MNKLLGYTPTSHHPEEAHNISPPYTRKQKWQQKNAYISLALDRQRRDTRQRV
jgi:hypothetical protein